MGINGRPARYTKKLAGRILSRIESGESLRAVCRDDGMPHRSIVLRWIAKDRYGFRFQYEEACALRALLWADEIIDIADTGSGDVPRDRLSMDARKWIVSKLLPRYADRPEVSNEAESIADSLKSIADRLPV